MTIRKTVFSLPGSREQRVSPLGTIGLGKAEEWYGESVGKRGEWKEYRHAFKSGEVFIVGEAGPL
ncbi:MAG: hypothetical protein VST70_04780 [Nitrospirota bacterium]|nr:hypothetical protein [Nitrospirota bacterium]